VRLCAAVKRTTRRDFASKIPTFFVASRFLIELGRADATVLVIWRADFA
jgi:hypothetical protein